MKTLTAAIIGDRLMRPEAYVAAPEPLAAEEKLETRTLALRSTGPTRR